MIRSLRSVAAIGLCVLLIWVLSPNAWAVDTTPSNPPTATTTYPTEDEDFSLGVSPTRLAIGQNDLGQTQQVLVINRGRLPAAVTVRKRNFTVDVTGQLDFQDDAPFAASEWVTVTPQAFEVPPGAAQTVTATIQTPVSPEPGDYQVALVFVVPSTADSNKIRINKGIGVPMFVTVHGPIDDSAVLSNLAAPGFAINGPVPITATVTNTGTVHRDFRGDAPLSIDTAGATAIFPDFTVPRDSVRDISTTWDPPLICICHPSVHFTNADGSVQSASVQVIVFPLKLLGIVLGALLVGLFAVWFFRRRHRANVTKAALALHRPVGRGDA